jgi:hypothetical protein
MVISVLVCRVPGNFHIEMRSKYHSVHPPVANLSHVVNSLTFGPPIERKVRNCCVWCCFLWFPAVVDSGTIG